SNCSAALESPASMSANSTVASFMLSASGGSEATLPARQAPLAFSVVSRGRAKRPGLDLRTHSLESVHFVSKGGVKRLSRTFAPKSPFSILSDRAWIASPSLAIASPGCAFGFIRQTLRLVVPPKNSRGDHELSAVPPRCGADSHRRRKHVSETWRALELEPQEPQ